MGLILFEFMAKSGKKLEDLINEVYQIVGPFSFERIDLHIPNDIKIRLLKIVRKENTLHLENMM